MPTRYDAATFFDSTTYQLSGGFTWSTNDESILISSDESGVFNVYRLDVKTGEKVALTHTNDSSFVVTSFPSDDRFLYRADKGGNEINHLYVCEADGKVRDLTPGDAAIAMFYGWTRDNKYFLVATNARDPQAFDLYRYRSDNYESELIFQNDETYMLGDFDGERYLVLIKAHSGSNSDLYLFDTLGDQPLQHISEHTGQVEYGVLSFSRDGCFLVYSSNEHGEYRQAWSFCLDTGEQEPLIAAHWDVVSVGYSQSGRYRVSAVNANARTVISLLDQPENKDVDLSCLPKGEVSALRFSRDETQLIVLLRSDTSPNDLYLVDLASQQCRRLTHALNPAIEEIHLVNIETIEYPSFDQLEIPGLMYKPFDATKESPCPALVYVHGGPGGQSVCGYDPLIQHLVNQGYAVLAANNRGSSGYGKTFFHLADRRHGELDLDDIVYARKYLGTLDWIDSQRIGIIGGSYGGYMVGAALAFRSDVFKVGIDIFGVMNWLRTLKSIPAWWGAQRDSLYDLMGDPETDSQRLKRISPLFHADNIQVPLLVVQGANDPRVLQAESDEIVAAVRDNGVPVDYVLFNDEGHGFTKRDNRITASEAYITFLKQYL